MKFLFIVVLLLCSNLAFNQIIDIKNVEQKKERLKDTAVEVFYEMSYYEMERTLSLNPYYTATTLGEKINETKRGLFSHVLGIRVPINKYIYVDAGISWLQNGELYSYDDPNSDSTLNYASSYRYFGMPVNLMFSLPLNPRQSETLYSFFIRAGGIPHLYQSFLQRKDWTTTFGSKESEKINSLENPNSFMFSWHISSGLSLYSRSSWGIRAAVHYRYSLTNTFTKYGDYIHKPFGIGYSLSLTKKI